MQSTDPHWPRRVALATDVEGLAVIDGLVHDAGFDADDVIFDEQQGTVEIELWRVWEGIHYRRWLWPIDLGVFEQTHGMLTIRHVEQAHINVDVMPTDIITDVSYEPDHRRLVLKLGISEPILLHVQAIWVELDDLAPPSAEGPHTMYGPVRLRW